MTTNVLFRYQWVDHQLQWDPKQFFGYEKLVLPPEKIWKPDIRLYNNVVDLTDELLASSRVQIWHNGTVVWSPVANMESWCKFYLTYFPFDDQICTLKFGSWTYDEEQLYMTNESSTVDVDAYIGNDEWSLIATKVARHSIYYSGWVGIFSDVTFSLYWRRQPLYWIIHVVAPTIVLSALSLFTFWMPVGSVIKAKLGITLLLSFFVLMMSVANQIPQTSKSVPLIAIYFLTIVAFAALSVAASAVVLYLESKGQQQHPVPQWIRWLTSVGKHTDYKSPGQSDIEASHQDAGTRTTWHQIAQLFDRVVFWIYLLGIVITHIVLLVIIPANKKTLDMKAEL